jgi:hypothetical protein
VFFRRIAIAGVVRSELKIPLHFARFGVESYQAIRVEVIAATHGVYKCRRGIS